MGHILSLVWYMIAVLPYLIFAEGFNMLQKYLATKGYHITKLHFLLAVLCIVFIILYLKGYR